MKWGWQRAGAALLLTGRKLIKVAISLGPGLHLSRFISQFILLLGAVLGQLISLTHLLSYLLNVDNLTSLTVLR